MKHIVFFLSIAILTNKIRSVEFNVFGNLTHENEFGCNAQVILQCIVNPNTDPVFWQVGKPGISSTALVARCSGFSCDINPIVSNLYNFSYDEDSGKSNMTIKNVSLEEDGKEYKCDDGSTSINFDAVVLVPPVEETTQITSTKVSGTTQITISTGCVTPRTAELVKCRWFKIQDDKTEAYTEAAPLTGRDDTPCQIYSDCITNGSIALSNNLTIEEHSDAPEVFFQVQCFLGNMELFTIKTSSTFQPKSGQDTNPFTNHTIVGTTSAAVSFSMEEGSNATKETVILNTTANSTANPFNKKHETNIFIIIIIVVVLLGAVVVAVFLFYVKRNTS